jgi:hypothetical protein
MTDERKPILPDTPPRSPDSGRDPMDGEPPPALRPDGPTRPPARKQLTTWIDADLHKRMLRLKVEEGIDLREQIDAAMRTYLKKYKYL